MRRYLVVVIKGEEPGVHVAYVPALHVVTQGSSLEHALAMAKEASNLVVEDMLGRRETVPDEEPGAVVSTVEVEAPGSRRSVGERAWRRSKARLPRPTRA